MAKKGMKRAKPAKARKTAAPSQPAMSNYEWEERVQREGSCGG